MQVAQRKSDCHHISARFARRGDVVLNRNRHQSSLY